MTMHSNSSGSLSEDDRIHTKKQHTDYILVWTMKQLPKPLHGMLASPSELPHSTSARFPQDHHAVLWCFHTLP